MLQGNGRLLCHIRGIHRPIIGDVPVLGDIGDFQQELIIAEGLAVILEFIGETRRIERGRLPERSVRPREHLRIIVYGLFLPAEVPVGFRHIEVGLVDVPALRILLKVIPQRHYSPLPVTGKIELFCGIEQDFFPVHIRGHALAAHAVQICYVRFRLSLGLIDHLNGSERIPGEITFRHIRHNFLVICQRALVILAVPADGAQVQQRPCRICPVIGIVGKMQEG